MDIDDLEDEVEQFADEIDDICEYDYSLNSVYLGTQIFYSPLVPNADIMFLGINPGPGYYDSVGENVRRFYPLDEHEYVTYDYTLASQWWNIFSNIGRLDLLENSFKTNCYYFATRGIKDFEQFRNLMYEHKDTELNDKAKLWTDIMLREINPKLLICEGMYVRNLLRDWWYQDEYIEYNPYSGYLPSMEIEVMTVKRTYSNLCNTERIEQALRKKIRYLGI